MTGKQAATVMAAAQIMSLQSIIESQGRIQSAMKHQANKPKRSKAVKAKTKQQKASRRRNR